MATIDHKARKQRIVRQSVVLFAKVGFKDVTFQMLADHCGISRTVLYRYFNDKWQIFNAAIREVVGRIVRKHAEIMRSKAGVADRIRQICTAAAATLFDNPEFLVMVMEVVTATQRGGRDLSRHIMRHTIGLKRIIQTLIVEGRETGEFRSDVNAELYTDLIYTQFESTLLRITVSRDASITDTLDRVDELIKGLKA